MTATFLEFGGERIDLVPLVDKAIAELGWVQPAAATWLAEGVAIFADRAPGRAIRKAIGEEVWTTWLTADGAKDAVKRFDATAEYVLRLAMAAGRWRQVEQVKDDRPYLRYVAVMDNRTHASCARRHDTVLPVDHPWWRKNAPPRRWDCRCTLQSLSERDLARYKLKVSEARPV